MTEEDDKRLGDVPARLLALAAEFEAQGRELLQRARECRRQAADLRKLLSAGGDDQMDPMQSPDRPGRDYKKKNLAISAARSDDPLREAANRAGLSLRELARRLRITPPALFHYRSRRPENARPVPRRVALEIERITGFRATPSNWPNGFSD